MRDGGSLNETALSLEGAVSYSDYSTERFLCNGGSVRWRGRLPLHTCSWQFYIYCRLVSV